MHLKINKLIFLNLIALFLLLLISYKQPMLLKYSGTLKYVDSDILLETINDQNKENKRPPDFFKNSIKEIPAKGNFVNSVGVNFEKNFQTLMQEGLNNCSSTINSYAWRLAKDKYFKFSIVHFLPRETLVDGHGHSVIYIDAFYDIYEGGIWKDSKNKAFNFKDLTFYKDNIAKDEFAIINFNKNRINLEKNYIEKLVTNHSISVITAKSFYKYINFIESIYIPFENKKIEKYFYDGLALYFSKLPTQLTSQKLDYLLGNYYKDFIISKFLLFISRALTLLIIILSFRRLINFIYINLKYKR